MGVVDIAGNAVGLCFGTVSRGILLGCCVFPGRVGRFGCSGDVGGGAFVFDGSEVGP